MSLRPPRAPPVSGLPLPLGSPYYGTPSPEVTGPICRVPWRGLSRSPEPSQPAHLCRFAERSPTVSSGTRGFSRQCGVSAVGPSRVLPITAQLRRRIYLPPSTPNRLEGFATYPRRLPSCVPPRTSTAGGAGILTSFPSATPFGFTLGYRLTLGGRTFPRYPWAFGGRDSHPPLVYSCPHSHFRLVQQPSRVCLRPTAESSPTASTSSGGTDPRLRGVA